MHAPLFSVYNRVAVLLIISQKVGWYPEEAGTDSSFMNGVRLTSFFQSDAQTTASKH